jgi:hypothetical protein
MPASGRGEEEGIVTQQKMMTGHAQMSAAEEAASEDRLREAAYDFMKAAGIDNPNPDAIGQLTEAFLPCLRIICERGYDPEGQNWRQKGWRGLVHDILDNAYRIKDRSWHKREFYPNGALDIINFAGFYLRMENSGPAWGSWGEPG